MSSYDKWDNNWRRIKSGEAKLWKGCEEVEFWKTSYAFLTKNHLVDGTQSILVPLCGDCAFIPYAVSLGHQVAGCELTKLGTEMLMDRMKTKFTESEFDKGKVFKMDRPEEEVKSEKSSGSLTIYNSNVLHLPVAKSSFDLIYDKDALGAIPIKMRKEYSKIVNATLRPGGHILLECKLRDDGDPTAGPPFHIDKAAVLALYGDGFELLDYVNDIYESGHKQWKQQAFILRKKGIVV